VQPRGNSHEGSDPGCIRIPLAAIFGYIVGNVVAHLLEKVCSILVARSSGMRLGAQLLDRTDRQSKRELFCILGGGIEKEEASDLVWCDRGCVGVLL
jgi:hypothetical protein